MHRFSLLCLWLMVGCSASVPAPVLRSVEPSTTFGQLETVVLVSGSFRPRVKVDFQAPDASVRSTQFRLQLEGAAVVPLELVTWVDESTLRARVPRGVAAGTYALRVFDPTAQEARLNDAVTVLDCAVSTCTLSDGGVVDAGARDAGRVDAGSDAGADEEDAGPPDAGPQPCALTTLADDDGDGFGRPNSEAMLCGSGRTMTPGDCDDVDPGTHLGATEFCNLIDDDCDSLVDENVCPVLNPNWIRRLDSPSDKSWRSVSAFGVGRLWLAGGGDVMVRVDGGFFEPANSSCPNELGRVWASPSGTAVLAGGNPAMGRLATLAPGAPGCANPQMLSDHVAGFFAADAGLVSGVLRSGRRFDWVSSASQPVELPVTFTSRLEHAHRAADGALFAAGSLTSQMKVWRWEAGQWVEERLASLSLPSGSLRSVWALSASRAFAVGDDGVVLEKVGRSWRRLPTPIAATVTSVHAFNQSRVYVTTSNGAVFRWDGRVWRTLLSSDAGVSFEDLDGVSESDLWVVGSRGTVFHWAE